MTNSKSSSFGLRDAKERVVFRRCIGPNYRDTLCAEADNFGAWLRRAGLAYEAFTDYYRADFGSDMCLLTKVANHS